MAKSMSNATRARRSVKGNKTIDHRTSFTRVPLMSLATITADLSTRGGGGKSTEQIPNFEVACSGTQNSAISVHCGMCVAILQPFQRTDYLADADD